ncbi:hypothetical protein [Pseudomonas sp. A-B-19]|uniref:hypothetical protein n=1 Tax=Pseudomonas sp. A-B-19 TaxID=2832405 RepID=UPI001CC0B6C1|nr:hypothetical protein [Pseudomonas sp. A-B-19]
MNKSKTLIAIVDLRAASKVSGIHPIVGVRNHQGVSDFDSQVLVTTNGGMAVERKAVACPALSRPSDYNASDWVRLMIADAAGE